jgi:branched-subunit amino acid aminotransferase/4-amino-4-deoxychorismate lyase
LTSQLLYNGNLVPEADFALQVDNRAFQFNDGFFETVIIRDGEISFWQDHLNRINEAAKALYLQLPDLFNSEDFKSQILNLADLNQATETGRIKIKIWRAGAGLYTPLTDKVDWLITATTTNLGIPKALEIGICKNTYTNLSPISHFKGPNAPLYVLASREKNEEGYDDMLVLDKEGFVAELTSSNIFWLKNGTLYTSDLGTGCINGIIRRAIIRWCKHNNLAVKEVYTKVDALLLSDLLFASNVTGLKTIRSIDGKTIDNSSKLISQLANDLKLDFSL